VQLRELIKSLLDARPHEVHARYATTFVDGSPGESGRCYFETADRWVVEIEGGPTLASTRSASVEIAADRRMVAHGPGSRRAPSRPPWSMVVAGLAPVYGRPEDDWAIVSAEFGSRSATLALDNVEQPGLHARVVIDIDRLIIVEMSTPSWAAYLSAQPSTRYDDLVAVLQRAATVVWDERDHDASSRGPN
jgi:hypothetical protein